MSNIKFLCPQGHELSANVSHAGKAGKCPKCGTRFVVPEPESLRIDTGASLPAKEDEFAFLCPNGHELHGPVSLKGRPGQCPDCGEKFLIPTDDDDEEEIPTGEVDEPDSTASIPVGEANAGDEDEVTEFVLDDISDDEIPEAAHVAAIPAAPGVARPSSSRLADVATWLNQLGAGSAPFEIRLRDGSVIRANAYAAALATSDYGIFASDDRDGKRRISAVAWDSIAVISLCEVEALPAGVFA